MSISNGDRFEIRHPEAAYLARKFIAVVRPSNRTDTPEGTDMVWIDYKHIVRCQPIVPKDVPF